MSTATHIAQTLRRILTHPSHGVAGSVDDLLTVCQKHHLQLDWQNDRCCVRSSGGAWEELTDLPIRKSIFRAILARIAALCNERTPNSVSPYGGQCEWLVGENPPMVFRVRFINTTAEQRLELTAGTEEAAALPQTAVPSAPSQTTIIR